MAWVRGSGDRPYTTRTKKTNGMRLSSLTWILSKAGFCLALKNRISRKQNKNKIIDTKNPTCTRSHRMVCRPLQKISHDGPFTQLKDYTRINKFNPHFLYFTFESNRFFIALLTREYCMSLLNYSVAIFMTVGMTNEFSEKVRQYRNCT